MADLRLQCRCGSVTGVARDVTARNGTRLVCMCDDCQTYAHYLGRAADILDENGGTEVYQTAPAHLEIHVGHDQIRCIRQHPRGLMRWFTACCNTPIFNTVATPRAPFTGVLAPFYAHEDPDVVDRTIGPVRAKTMARWGYGTLPDDAHPRAPMSVLLHATRVLGSAFLAGKHKPNPLLGPAGEPIATPIILTEAERTTLKQQAVESGP